MRVRPDAITLKRLTVHRLAIPFRLSFKHAAAERKQGDLLVLALESDNGVVGYGECHARDYVTGETLDGALQDLTKLWWPAVRGLALKDSSSPREVLARFFAEATRTGRLAAYGAVDLAVFDLWARAFKVPGRRLFGAESARTARVSAPIGLGMPPGLTARFFKACGFKDFKVKVGASKDLERLTAIRLAVGEAARLRVDANGAWTREAAFIHAKVMKELHLESIEQPLPKNRTAEMVKLAAEIDIPLMADESLCTLGDAETLAAASPKILWNVRLGKVGGFSGALAMLELAQQKGIRYQLGALVGETSLLTAAQRALLSVADPVVVESSFPKLLLAADPFHGGPSPLSAKATTLGMAPGLGVELKTGALTRFGKQSVVLD